MTNNMPWYEKAIRRYEKEHGPCGTAWNISAILDTLRKADEKRYGSW